MNFEIANSLVKRQPIELSDANSALLAALQGKNTSVIGLLCLAVFGADQDQLEKMAPHLTGFTFIRTDTVVYKEDCYTNLIFRGAQLLLIYQTGAKNEVQEALDCFRRESELVKDEVAKKSTIFMVYSKLLSSTGKSGSLPNFWELICTLDIMMENQGAIFSPEITFDKNLADLDGLPIISFLFLNQIHQVRKIDQLIPIFYFLNYSKPDLRNKLFLSYTEGTFEVDSLVSIPWLREHEENTIDPINHSKIFSELEQLAESWGNFELAVCCRRYGTLW